MPHVEAWFAPLAESVVLKPGRSLSRSDLVAADVLLVRSVTQVNAELLAGTPVQFVGSATIGTDHIDQDYLTQQNIRFHYAPGCNAQSVTDWVVSVLARLQLDYGLAWRSKTIGVVGVGNVGSRVADRLAQCGARVLRCDPQRHRDGSLPEHRPLDSLLAASDIVCLHTPHTRSGPDATEGLIGEDQLARMQTGSWLINAGRGPVIQHAPLLKEVQSGRLQAVLDVWPNEPQVDEPLLSAVALAAPHVAGYSLEGRFTGTRMLAEALAQANQLRLPTSPRLPQVPALDVMTLRDEDHERWLSKIVLAVYDPQRDTETLRQTLTSGQVRSQDFDRLRKQYPTRRELASVPLLNTPKALIADLAALGFQP